MALTVSELSALKASLEFWDVVEYASTLIVLVGVLGEYIAEFTEFAQKRGLMRKLGKLSTLVLIVGLGGELVGLVRTSQLSGELVASLEDQSGQAIKNAEAANTTAKRFDRDISRANERAKNAEVQIASSNARAAEAQKQAAEAKLELAKLKEPRTVNQEQQRRIRAKIKPFAGTKFDLYVSTGSSEPVALMNTIEGTLRSAGWVMEKPSTPILFADKAGVAALSGLLVQIARERSADFLKAATALASALRAEGIEARAEANLDTGNNHDAIHVMIGSKP